jgi:hypothetical protein
VSRDNFDQDTAPTTVVPSRRQFISASVTIAVAGLAGCSGGGGGNGNPEDSSGSTEPSSGECPSLPLSYSEKRVDAPPSVAFEVPASAGFVVAEGSTGATIKVEIEQISRSSSGWTLTVRTGTRNAPSVEAIEIQERQDELTSEYDLAVDGARVISDPQFPDVRIVYLPGDSGPIRARVSHPTIEDPQTCSDAALEARRQVIETIRPGT